MKTLLEKNKIIIALIGFAIFGAIVLIGVQYAGSSSVVVQPTSDQDADENAHNGDYILFNEKMADADPETITGTLTEVFTDCVERKTLNAKNKVITTTEGITCDGGSYVKIDDVTFLTASGFVEASQAFDKHNKDLNPGDAVTITALKVPSIEDAETDTSAAENSDTAATAMDDTPASTDDTENEPLPDSNNKETTYTLNCETCSIELTEPDETVQISGAVQEVFTDCVERKTLDADGNIVLSTEGISCDGGSYVMVNDAKIITASGKVPANLAFNKHNKDLDPGQDVQITAIKTGEIVSLNCNDCSLKIVTNTAQ